ncbi:ABC transporter permease subunit [Shinella oryzae]|uniref:ABC transporter permease subunit n=1 Tax=Shinella oryzae TaxID=2871820 RepID=UPI001FF6E4E2|nr:branched-chain amino acid ABC transporter permease LivH [Shinella oryzae]UPA26954.1 branched-chain amino acid ABC transporter permease LivH [Shinella oryzae]
MDAYILVQQLFNGITLGTIYGLIAVGYTMVYGVIRMINFAHGDVYMVSAYIAAIALAVLTFFGVQSVPFALISVLVITCAITAVYGWAIERVAYRPLRGSTKLAPLISAIGISLMLQSYVQIAQGARDQGVPTLISGVFRFGDGVHFAQITYMQTVILFASLIAMGILTYVINYTRIGRECRAVQQNIRISAVLGVNTDRIISTVFVIGAATAAVGGVLVTFNYGSFNFFIGFVMGIKAFTAAVLGGIGSLPGAVLGGVLLGLTEALFAGYVSTDYKDVFAFALLIVLLFFRPYGLLGRPEIQKV